MASGSLILVKTASEIAIKSDFVQKRFTGILVKNMRTALKNAHVSVDSISTGRGRLFVSGSDASKSIGVLSRVFGIHELAPVTRLEKSDFESVVSLAILTAKSELKAGDSFCVRCSRSGQHFFSSKDIEIEAGSRILEAVKDVKVKLVGPTKTVFVEVYPKAVVAYSSTVKGLEGLPVGSQGRIGLLLDSSSEDVFLAGFLLLKRGCNLVAVQTGKTGESALKRLEAFNSLASFSAVKADELSKVADVNILASAKTNFGYSDSDWRFPVLYPLIGFPKEVLPAVAK
ncbi:MAG: hypothetical protein J4215_00560 [Candidatus Diapherotrites archaeon]|uniref:THUMP domain-containing protein n=1 Tax=Candidatus Iainarchaeum sp. TaxID=3101447 RepID=A0A8T4L3K2_9ARCH|nr:hypothetical protein [Candidatus Diapherotrites archaeon]